MPLDVTFTLSDQDLQHFQDIVDKAREALTDQDAAANVEAAARSLLQQTRETALPEFVAERMDRLSVVLGMINDAEWQLPEDDRRRILSALAYFCDPEDVIPDHVPGLGFLDDAIYAEIVLESLGSEIRLYEEFCEYRHAEEQRRKARGEDIHVGREEWLADKRAALHARMRKRRMSGESRGSWRMRLW